MTAPLIALAIPTLVYIGAAVVMSYGIGFRAYHSSLGNAEDVVHVLAAAGPLLAIQLCAWVQAYSGVSLDERLLWAQFVASIVGWLVVSIMVLGACVAHCVHRHTKQQFPNEVA